MAVIWYCNQTGGGRSPVQTIHSDPAVSFLNAFSVFQRYKEPIDHRSLSTISVIQEKFNRRMICKRKYVPACHCSPSERVKVKKKKKEPWEVRCDDAPDYFWSDISINFFMQFSVWPGPENDGSVSRRNLSRNFWLCWVNLLFKVLLTQYFPSCIICSVYRLRESSWSVLIKRKRERSPQKKWEHFTILIGRDQKSKTF